MAQSAALQIRSALFSRKCKMTATPKIFMLIPLQYIDDRKMHWRESMDLVESMAF